MSGPPTRTLSPFANVQEGVLLSQWTRLLFEGLVRGGIRDAVICPGSRSTPLALEALRRSEIRCHSVIDERSAGFFSLGMARATGVPPLLICTSGSALAHFLAALIEATHSGLPLVVMSADRPSELWGCGAPQTIDQERIFGQFSRSTPRLSEPSLRTDALRALLRKGEQAVAMSCEALPGPVHINVPLPKPLSPIEAESADEKEFVRFVDTLCKPAGTRFVLPQALPPSESRHSLLEQLNSSVAPLLITLGPTTRGAAKHARKLASLLEAPLVSELPQAGSAAPLDALAAQLQKVAAPLQVLHLGPPCISGRWNDFIENDHVELHMIPGVPYLDPSNRSRTSLPGSLQALLPALIEDLETANPKPVLGRCHELFACIHALTERVPRAVQTLRGFDSAQALPEALAVHLALETMRNEDTLLLANSLTLRLAAWVAPASQTRPRAIYTTRGANGIDGFIATACGTALQTQGASLALVGDVTFAHDIGSLALCHGVHTPLVFVLLDNGGGRIFDHLPAHAQWGEDPEVWKFWNTAPVVNFQKAAEAFHLPYSFCSTESDLRQALSSAMQQNKVSVVHVKTNSQSTQAYLTHLLTAADSC